MTLPKPFGAFLALQDGGTAKSSGMPAGGDRSDSGGPVVAVSQDQAGGLYGRLIKARWDYKQRTGRRSDIEFALRNRASEDGRISEQETTAPAEQAGPLGQCSTAVREMHDRIDAKNCIEGVVLKGQPPTAVEDSEGDAVGEPARGCLSLSVGDSRGLDIQADEPTSGSLD